VIVLWIFRIEFAIHRLIILYKHPRIALTNERCMYMKPRYIEDNPLERWREAGEKMSQDFRQPIEPHRGTKIGSLNGSISGSIWCDQLRHTRVEMVTDSFAFLTLFFRRLRRFTIVLHSIYVLSLTLLQVQAMASTWIQSPH
jgi:hypothetical protein